MIKVYRPKNIGKKYDRGIPASLYRCVIWGDVMILLFLSYIQFLNLLKFSYFKNLCVCVFDVLCSFF